MLLVYSGTPTQLQQIRRDLPHPAYVQSSDAWPEFERSLHHAACAVLFIPWLDDGTVERLERIRRLHPLCRTILVTTRDFDNARRLKDTRVSEVVWQCEFSTQAASLFSTPPDGEPLAHLGDALQASPQLPRMLAMALATACRRERPFGSVKALAAALKCDRHTLWFHWHHAARDGSFRLKDFLDWIILLHALLSKRSDRSWSAVAFHLRVHEHTLSRSARRLTGRTLSQVEAAGYAQLVGDFLRRVAQALPGLVPASEAAEPHGAPWTLLRPEPCAAPSARERVS